jgi:hypothetical protein
MEFNSWLKWVALAVVPIVMVTSRRAVAEQIQKEPVQQDDPCFIENSSGQRTTLDKLCGKSGEKASGKDFMWDETNYDPKFVKKMPDGFWSYTKGAPHPFRTPKGSIFWPDGRIESHGMIAKPVSDTAGKFLGLQRYKADGITPLKPGEQYKYPSGMTVTQARF